MKNLTAILAALSLTLTAIADAKPRKAPRDSTRVKSCIAERTGPDGGMSVREARSICRAEEPEDEVSAARKQLARARLNAKVSKAKERVRKAVEACAQAVTDRCVENADPVKGSDCDIDAGLKAEFALTCLAMPEVK